MKCAVAVSVLLAACSMALADSREPRSSARPASSPSVRVLEDLVRMSKAGSSDATVLAYARAHRTELPEELSDSTLRWLRASGVSERVVRYMSAIDVRASEGTSSAPEGVTWADEASDRDDLMERRGDREPAESYGDTEAYAGYDSGSGGYGYGYDSGFGYDPYLYFGYPYLSAPYFSYYFVNRGDFFRRFRDHRNHRGGGDHRFDGGRGGWRDRGGPREAWRERGSVGRARGAIAAGPRNAGRSFAGGAFRGPRGGGRGLAPRGFASRGYLPSRPSGPARSSPRAFSGQPRSSVSLPSRGGSGFGRPSSGGRGRR
jgi:hypothetical protein